MTMPYGVRLTREQVEALKEIAKQERRSLTKQIEVALAQWIAAHTALRGVAA